jgi:uncharacterized membrane-anchored protein YitT (DUF2179 family)
MNSILVKFRDDPKYIKATHFISVVFGNLLLAAGYGLFLLPANIVAGGLGGIGVIVNYLFHIDAVNLITILTWIFFFLGLIFLGKKFALKTLVSSIIYPFFLALFDNWTWLLDKIKNVNNPLLLGIVGSILTGVGIGLVFRSGGSTGGVDIPGFIVQKYLKIPSERVIFLMDIIVISFGMMINIESVLIGIIVALINLIVIDKFTVGGNKIVVAHIISSEYQKINDYIMNVLSRGSTIIPSIGGYKSHEKMLIEAAVARREFAYLNDYIRKVDPDAFVILLNARDVYGLGFRNNNIL